MSRTGTSVAALLSPEIIHELAQPANVRYGTAIFRRGGVEYIDAERARVEAWVGGLSGSVAEGGSQRRRTRLFVKRGQLAWHCAGNPKDHQIFCKHCVALALSMLATEKRGRRGSHSR